MGQIDPGAFAGGLKVFLATGGGEGGADPPLAQGSKQLRHRGKDPEPLLAGKVQELLLLGFSEHISLTLLDRLAQDRRDQEVTPLAYLDLDPLGRHLE